MKLYKVFFSTESEISPFGEIPDIIKKAELIGLPLTYKSGGWENDETKYYHEWESIDDTAIVKDFVETQYKDSLIYFYADNNSPENNSEPDQNSMSGS